MATETLALAEGVGAELTLPTPILQALAVSKQFPGVLALDQVDLELRAGKSMFCLAKTAPANRP